ncbi:MAG: tyrosine-type recombinase/integrase [Bacillota bacterium]|nr:tyrosine-type recombinase/integrase [Bacillota bacterium]
MPTPRWDENRQYWKMDARYKGKRKTFYSKIASGKRGPAECRQKYLEWIESVDQPEGIFFSDAWQEYLDWYRIKNKVTSWKGLRTRGAAHLLRPLKNKKLSEITKADWQRIIDQANVRIKKKTGHGASRETLEGIATTIRGFCKFAAGRGWIADIDVPIYFDYPVRTPPKKAQILQPSQLALLLSPETDDASWYIHCFRFIALTGIRRGEFCALKASRDYRPPTESSPGQIIINESISHDLDVTDGKSIHKGRVITLGRLAQIELDAHIARAKDTGRVSKPVYLFPDADGGLLKPRRLSDAWRFFASAHGITVTLHHLRHTFVSYGRQLAGVSEEDIKLLVGHTEQMSTDRTYNHEIDLLPEDQRKRDAKALAEAEAINSVFERILDAMTV